MERSEKHKHSESRETIGDEFAEHQKMVNTGSTKKRVERFLYKAR